MDTGFKIGLLDSYILYLHVAGIVIRLKRVQPESKQRVNDDANTALDHVFQQLARYEKALRPMPQVVGAAGGAPRALICKPDLALKPEELTSDMSPVVFVCRPTRRLLFMPLRARRVFFA
jgi:hypothetical protein